MHDQRLGHSEKGFSDLVQIRYDFVGQMKDLERNMEYYSNIYFTGQVKTLLRTSDK